MLRCFISEGQIYEGPCRVPKAWRNISGLDKATDEYLISLGWLPFIDVKPAYDKDTQYITGSRVITADAVTMNNVVNDYTEEEMTAKIAAAKIARKNVIRAEAKALTATLSPVEFTPNVDIEVYMKPDVGDVVAVSDAAEASVDEAETLAEIRAVVPVWPDVEVDKAAYDTKLAKITGASVDMKDSVFYNKTPAQLNTYIDANWGTLASSKATFKKLVLEVRNVVLRQGWE